VREPGEETAAPQPPDPYEGAVPPGYDWPTHGGYLGCLLGIMASCLIGGFAGKLVGLFTYYHNITGIANVLAIGAVFVLAAAILGALGWRLGRRFLREYARQPTWGENDSYVPEGLPSVQAPFTEGAAGNDSAPPALPSETRRRREGLQGLQSDPLRADPL
jgi:hypothetical protein